MTYLSSEDIDVEHVEVNLLLEGIYQVYGLDYRGYAKSSIRRRIKHRMGLDKIDTVSELQARVLQSKEEMNQLFMDFSINVTEMFRDSKFYRVFREKVIPLLRNYRFIRIWHAGCSTGEEVYSMAILLTEEELYDRTRIYATDLNPEVLNTARNGILPIDNMREYTENYIKSGGQSSFSSYYTAGHGSVKFHDWLTQNVVFFPHNLVTDASFNEFHVILCRNVMIYFGKELQDRVHNLLYHSLDANGILALGSGESIRFTPFQDCYKALDESSRIYRRAK